MSLDRDELVWAWVMIGALGVTRMIRDDVVALRFKEEVEVEDREELCVEEGDEEDICGSGPKNRRWRCMC